MPASHSSRSGLTPAKSSRNPVRSSGIPCARTGGYWEPARTRTATLPRPPNELPMEMAGRHPGAVVLLAVGSVQAVLWSDWPRQTVISRLQNQFGFRITADSLDTGWTGHTEIHNTTLALPLASEPFLTVPVMRVRHSNLAVLAAGGFSLDSIELDRPTFNVRQDSTGSWNVKDILSLLQQAFVSPVAPATGSGGPSPPPVLPNITVTDGTVIVVDRDGHTASITPLTIDGHSMSAVAWSIAASVPGAFSITGQVVARQPVEPSHPVIGSAD